MHKQPGNLYTTRSIQEDRLVQTTMVVHNFLVDRSNVQEQIFEAAEKMGHVLEYARESFERFLDRPKGRGKW